MWHLHLCNRLPVVVTGRTTGASASTLYALYLPAETAPGGCKHGDSGRSAFRWSYRRNESADEAIGDSERDENILSKRHKPEQRTEHFLSIGILSWVISHAV
jgi:hypothetical protein